MRQSDKESMQVRISSELHKALKIRAAEESKTIRQLLDELLMNEVDPQIDVEVVRQRWAKSKIVRGD